MSVMKKLIEIGSPLERELLDSARYDGLSKAARRRHLRLFGMSGTLLTLLGTARDAVAAVAGASKSTLLLAGSVTLAGIGGLSYAVNAHRLDTAISRAPTVAPTAVAPSAPSDTPPAAPAATAPAERTAPQAERAALSPTVANTPSGAANVRNAREAPSVEGAQTQRLEQETALLMDVHALMRNGQTRAASKRLAEYRAQFPNGQLRLEGEVVEVELMSAHGNKARAAQRATALLRSQAAGPYSARLRAIEAAGADRAPAN